MGGDFKRRRYDQQCPNTPEREKEKEMGEVGHLDLSVLTPHTQLITTKPERVSSYPSDSAQLLKRGPPGGGMVDGGAGSGKVR